jgi:hypothetical protein
MNLLVIVTVNQKLILMVLKNDQIKAAFIFVMNSLHP